jgi:hypothetical protein
MTLTAVCFRVKSGDLSLVDTEFRRLRDLGLTPERGETRFLFAEALRAAVFRVDLHLHNPFTGEVLCELQDPGEVQLYWEPGLHVCSVRVSPVDLLTVRRLSELMVQFRLVTDQL